MCICVYCSDCCLCVCVCGFQNSFLLSSFSSFVVTFYSFAKHKTYGCFLKTAIIFSRYPFLLPYRVVCPIYFGCCIHINTYNTQHVYRYLPHKKQNKKILWNVTSTGNKMKNRGLGPCACHPKPLFVDKKKETTRIEATRAITYLTLHTLKC